MNVKKNLTFRSNRNIAGVILAVSFLLFSSVSGLFADSQKMIPRTDSFIITGSEFFQRSQFDTGEIRIFLKNTGNVPVSVSRCELSRFATSPIGDSNEDSVEINYLYSKLTPPLLMPAQDGELLLKLLKKPPPNSYVRCAVHDNADNISQTTLPVEQALAWIPYIGFSDDLSKVYVYVQNNGSESLKAELLRINDINVGDNYRSINNQIPPGDTGSLVFNMPMPLRLGEYVCVSISANSGTRKWQTQRIVRAVNRFPLIFEAGAGDPASGLDSEKFFITSTSATNSAACIQSMICPAHAHGTYENAARKFLDNYYSIFSQNQYLLSQMWICRSGMPMAWYKFGPLPDITVMNPVLLGLTEYEAEAKSAKFFHPFFWLADSAKKATAPNRYLACIPLKPEDKIFLQNTHTPDEIRFLTYCAIASGAKGIVYRNRVASDQLSKDGFVRLNKELAQLKAMLMIAEPVDWALVVSNKYIAKSLLCGDEAILVIVFDGRCLSKQKDSRLYTPAFEKRLNPVNVKVAIPYGVQISEVESMYGPLSNKLWRCSDNQLDFTANMVDSVQIYKLIITQEDGETSSKEPAKQCKNENI